MDFAAVYLSIKQRGKKFRSPARALVERWVVRRFHQIVYDRDLWATTQWMGHKVYQYPSDLLMKQEIIAEVRPSLLIECGTLFGGSALFYAHLFDALGHGRVLSIDIAPKSPLPQHPRIEYFVGSSTASKTSDYATSVAKQAEGPVMVTLDSLHTKAHVARELALYHPLVTPGSYLIVEDGEINGHPVFTRWAPDQGEGPSEAIAEFLPLHPEFVPDKTRERWLVTSHPNGYLRRQDVANRSYAAEGRR